MKNKITVIRKSMKMSQKELADRTNITETSIRNIEKSRTIPNVEIAIRIAKVLKTTVEEIFIIE